MPARAVVVALVAAVAVVGAPAVGRAQPPADRRVVLALLPGGPDVLERLGRRPGLALGLASATQGGYSRTQALLDLTSGTRTSRSTYDPPAPPRLSVRASGSRGEVRGWGAVRRRAASAPADVRPGLLASGLPGGAAFAGAGARAGPAALAAADEEGRIAALSLGPPRSLVARARRLSRRFELVVADLPPGREGARALSALLRTRPAGELLLVLRAPPLSGLPQLLPLGVNGPGFAAGALTSATTHREGLVALIDVAPTVLGFLGRPVPDAVRGEPIEEEGERDPAALRALADRLSVVPGRRDGALGAYATGWLALVVLLGLARGRRGARAGLRVGGLGVVWLPAVLLVCAALAPSRALELALIVLGSFALAALTDRLVPWPRAPAVPAAAGLALYAVDLARSSELIGQQLLGPNPRAGSRFYGVGNELEIALTLLLLLGLAAALPRRERSVRAATAFALGGLALALLVTPGPLGADVGGVFTIGAGAGGAVLLLLPGRTTPRRLALAALVPVLGLALLALIDTLAGGESHFSRSVLDAGDDGLRDAVERRVELALANFENGAVPLVSAVAVLAALYAVWRRDRVYAALGGDPVWPAGLGGGLAAAVAGTLTNDSGPLLLIIGVGGLAAVTAYLRAPPPAGAAPRRTPPAGDARARAPAVAA